MLEEQLSRGGLSGLARSKGWRHYLFMTPETRAPHSESGTVKLESEIGSARIRKMTSC